MHRFGGRIAVGASAAAAHLSALGAGFVWLDHAHLEGKLATVPLSRLGDLFTRGLAGTGYYRPLMGLSLSIDALFESALVFHATSIAWHVAAAVLVAIAAEVFGLTRRASTIAGIFFAIHPVTALVADAIAFRSEAMLTAFLLGLLVAHARRKWWLAGPLLFAAASTKETGLILAPLFVVTLALAKKELPRALLFSEGLGLALAAGLRIAFAPAWRASPAALGIEGAVGTRLAALAKSVAAIVLPVDRSVCDAFPITHVWHPTALVGAIAVIGIAWGAKTRRGPALYLALAILPALQFVPITRWWSPHYLYLPLAFFAMLAAEAVEKRSARVLLATYGALVVLGIVTFVDGFRYENDVALWTPEVAHQPACKEAQFYLGDVAREKGDLELAARLYEASLAKSPSILAYVDRGAALQNLGVVRVTQKRFADARAAFRSALEGTQETESRREITFNLAAASLSDGDAFEAARLLEDETARADAIPAALEVRAMALDRLGRADEARALRARR